MGRFTVLTIKGVEKMSSEKDGKVSNWFILAVLVLGSLMLAAGATLGTMVKKHHIPDSDASNDDV